MLSISASVAAAPPQLKSAVEAYNEKRYGEALGQFQHILQQHPNDSDSHYYSGLCYQALNQIKPAQQEYMWVYSNSQNAKLRYNSWVALTQIGSWSQHRAYAGNGPIMASARTVIRRS